MNSRDARQFKDLLFEQFARISRALAHRRRLELLDLLAQGERTVEDLACETGSSVASTSRDLRVLLGARLVDFRRQGLYAYYRLAGMEVFRLWQSLRDAGAARLAEVDQLVTAYLRERSHLEPISSRELLHRLREDSVILLDVRPKTEYAAGHIAGARSVPVAELRRRLRDLPRDVEVIAYCRGPFCVFADEALALLRKDGFRSRRLAGGFPDWHAAGLPIADGPQEPAPTTGSHGRTPKPSRRQPRPQAVRSGGRKKGRSHHDDE
jgi:rhodanese-related sulfurtransferase